MRAEQVEPEQERRRRRAGSAARRLSQPTAAPTSRAGPEPASSAPRTARLRRYCSQRSFHMSKSGSSLGGRGRPGSRPPGSARRADRPAGPSGRTPGLGPRSRRPTPGQTLDPPRGAAGRRRSTRSGPPGSRGGRARSARRAAARSSPSRVDEAVPPGPPAPAGGQGGQVLGEVVVEDHPLGRQAVEVGRLDPAIAVRPEEPEMEPVADDDDDIHPPSLTARRRSGKVVAGLIRGVLLVLARACSTGYFTAASRTFSARARQVDPANLGQPQDRPEAVRQLVRHGAMPGGRSSCAADLGVGPETEQVEQLADLAGQGQRRGPSAGETAPSRAPPRTPGPAPSAPRRSSPGRS